MENGNTEKVEVISTIQTNSNDIDNYSSAREPNYELESIIILFILIYTLCIMRINKKKSSD